MTSILLKFPRGGCGDLRNFLGSIAQESSLPSFSNDHKLPSVLSDDNLPPYSYIELPCELGHVWALMGEYDASSAPQCLENFQGWRGSRVIACALDAGFVCRAWLGGSHSRVQEEVEKMVKAMECEGAGADRRVLLVGNGCILSPVGYLGGDSAVEAVRRVLTGAPMFSELSQQLQSFPQPLNEIQCLCLSAFFRLLAVRMRASIAVLPGPEGVEGGRSAQELLALLLSGESTTPRVAPSERMLLPNGLDTVEAILDTLPALERNWGGKLSAAWSQSNCPTPNNPPPCFFSAAQSPTARGLGGTLGTVPLNTLPDLSALSQASSVTTNFLLRGSATWAEDCATALNQFMAARCGGDNLGCGVEAWAESLVAFQAAPEPSSVSHGEGISTSLSGIENNSSIASSNTSTTTTSTLSSSRRVVSGSGGVGPRASLSRRSSFGVSGKGDTGSLSVDPDSLSRGVQPPVNASVEVAPPPPKRKPRKQ